MDNIDKSKLINEVENLMNEKKKIDKELKKYNTALFEQMKSMDRKEIIPENYNIKESDYNNQYVKDENDFDSVLNSRGWDTLSGKEKKKSNLKTIWDLFK